MTGSAAALAVTDPAHYRIIAADPYPRNRLVDRSWLVLDGVLFEVAGSLHTDRAVTGHAQWVSTRRAEQLRRHLNLSLLSRRDAGPPAAPALLHYGGDSYLALADLGPPPLWPAVHTALGDAGIQAVEASLLATAAPDAAQGLHDPIAAARTAAAQPGHGHHCGLVLQP